MLAVVLGTAFLVACGSDEGATPLAVTVTETGDQVNLGLPSSVESGVVDLTLTNNGQGPHSLQFVKVTGDHSTDELLEFINSGEEGGPIPDWISEGGGIGIVGPGQTGTSSFELSEGKHIVWDDQSGENEQSNATRGGIAEITVTEGGGGSLPEADATITATEFRFQPEDLKAGKNKVEFVNDGQEFHHVQAFPIADGSTIADVKAFFETEGEPTGPPPLNFEQGVGTPVMGPGNALVTEWQLQSGNYALVCFINNRTGGPPHVNMGMLNEVTVA
jgi:plastocyanin